MPDKQADTGELKVFINGSESTCGDCKAQLARGTWITLAGEKGLLCLDCADLAHLTFLPSGDAALTRRAKKHSTLSAVVLKWARRRRRYERQGLLVEEAALEKAEAECLADADVRQRKQARAAIRRDEVDRKFIDAFAAKVRELYPACPPGRDKQIADHACQKFSGRVGRSASAKELEEKPVRLAVAAHVRHLETGYDALLAKGIARHTARDTVKPIVDAMLQKWSTGRR